MAEIAPAFVEREFRAIGYVTGYLPMPGGREGLGGCSATLIAPDLILTAAHCVARRRDRPQDNYVTFGWRDDGPPLWRGAAAEIIVDPDFERSDWALDTLASDVALLRLPRPVPEDLIAPLPLAPGFGAAPDVFAIYGFPRGEPTLLRGHPDCEVVLIQPGVIGSDCPVQSGFSGAPLLRREGGRWVVAAVMAATALRDQGPIRSFAALPSDAVLRASGLGALPQ